MNQSTIAKLGSLPLVVLAVLAVNRGLDLGFLLDPERLETWLRAQGVSGPFLFMGLMALAVVVSPIPDPGGARSMPLPRPSWARW